MKKYIKSSETMDLDFSNDYLLPLEHELDMANATAWTTWRQLNGKGLNNPASQIKDIAFEIEKMISRIRTIRSYMQSYYGDTEETMLEDSSRYLED